MEKVKYNKWESAAFSGHRFISLKDRKNLKEKLREQIRLSYAAGIRNFYCGMAIGFDLMAAEEVYAMSHIYPDMKLIAVVPHMGQTQKWKDKDKLRYSELLNAADEVIFLSRHYYDGCLLRRNDYMLAHAKEVIAYFDGTPKGGTFYTCRKAQSMGMKVVNLF